MFAIHLPLAALLTAGLCYQSLPASSTSPIGTAPEPAATVAPVRSSDLPDEILALLPTDATGVFAFESVDALGDLIESFDQDQDDLLAGLDEALFHMLSEGQIDTALPFAAAFGEPQMAGMPLLTFAVPLAAGIDGEDLPFKDYEGILSYQLEDGYLGLSMAPEYPDSGLNEELADAVTMEPIGFALDAEVWVASFGPMIDYGISLMLEEALAEVARDPDLDEDEARYAQGFTRTYIEGIADLVSSASILSTGILLNGSHMEVFLDVALQEDSAASDMAGDEGVTIEDCIHSMGLLPTGGFAMGRSFDEDLTLVADLVEQFLEDEVADLTEEEAGVAVSVIEGMLTLLDCGPTAVSGPIYIPGVNGPGALMLHGADTDTVIAGFQQIINTMEAEFEGFPAELDVHEGSLHYAISLVREVWLEFLGEESEDLEIIEEIGAVLGDSFDLAITDAGDRVLVMFGAGENGTDLVEEAADGEGSLSDNLERIEERLEGAYPFFAMEINLQELLGTTAAFIVAIGEGDEEDPELIDALDKLDGEDSSFSFYFGMREDRWTMGLGLDLDGMKAIGEVMGD